LRGGFIEQLLNGDAKRCCKPMHHGKIHPVRKQWGRSLFAAKSSLGHGGPWTPSGARL